MRNMKSDLLFTQVKYEFLKFYAKLLLNFEGLLWSWFFGSWFISTCAISAYHN